jgi:hypothetical protein
MQAEIIHEVQRKSSRSKLYKVLKFWREYFDGGRSHDGRPEVVMTDLTHDEAVWHCERLAREEKKKPREPETR